MASMDDILKQMTSALDACQSVVAQVDPEEPVPEFVSDLLAKTGKDEVEGVSLLSLKNQVLLGYVSNAVLAVLEHLQRLEGADLDQGPIERTVVQRVTMEKGIRPLEKKLAYQLDKMLRTYTREHQRVMERQQSAQEAAGTSGAGSVGAGADDSGSESESEDELNFKPDTSAGGSGKAGKDGDKSSDGKYRPPKLAATALPTTGTGEDAAEPKTKKLQSMEEYLREQSDAPTVEASIGSTIVDHGRGGVKTSFDKKREKEIQDYEEANFTRLPERKTQKSSKQRRKDQLHTFGGEDFSIFNNDRSLSEGTSRKRKAMSAWDRAKRRK